MTTTIYRIVCVIGQIIIPPGWFVTGTAIGRSRRVPPCGRRRRRPIAGPVTSRPYTRKRGSRYIVGVRALARRVYVCACARTLPVARAPARHDTRPTPLPPRAKRHRHDTSPPSWFPCVCIHCTRRAARAAILCVRKCVNAAEYRQRERECVYLRVRVCVCVYASV